MIQVLEKSVRGKEFRQMMHEHVDQICDMLEADQGVASFAICGFGFDGRWTNSFRVHDECIFGYTLIPVMFAETFRNRNMEHEAENVLDGYFNS